MVLWIVCVTRETGQFLHLLFSFVSDLGRFLCRSALCSLNNVIFLILLCYYTIIYTSTNNLVMILIGWPLPINSVCLQPSKVLTMFSAGPKKLNLLSFNLSSNELVRGITSLLFGYTYCRFEALLSAKSSDSR